MSSRRPRPPARVPSVVVAASALALGAAALTGCTTSAPGGGPASPSTSAAPSPAASGATPTADPGYTPPPPVSSPLALDCAAQLDPAADVLPTLWPGLAAADAPDADALDDALAQVAEADGTVCDWVDAAGDHVTVGVAAYDEASLTAIANDLVASSNSVPSYGVEGYFSLHGGTGVARALPTGRLVVAESTTFAEPGSAEPVMTQLLAAVGEGGAG